MTVRSLSPHESPHDIWAEVGEFQHEVQIEHHDEKSRTDKDKIQK